MPQVLHFSAFVCCLACSQGALIGLGGKKIFIITGVRVVFTPTSMLVHVTICIVKVYVVGKHNYDGHR